MNTVKRGRPSKMKIEKVFDPSIVNTLRGSDLYFGDSLFEPMKTNTELDVIFSTEGGLMPGTNMMFAGGPGSGKSTVVLDVLSNLTMQGYKTLFVSGEMDEIAYYKYCKRLPKVSCVEVLFLKNYADDIKEVLEYVFKSGYDVVGIDSIAEVIDMYKDAHKCTEGMAESWLLHLQDTHKKGNNDNNYFTTFINIQQMTKSGDFAGSNRLKHMVDAFCHVERSKDSLQRKMFFSKNRDCDKDFEVYFSINSKGVYYAYESAKEEA
jgi:DNA repair protein RadA/Sms